MKALRLLICLFATVALAMPPLSVKAAAPPALHAGMDCPHSAADGKDKPADQQQNDSQEHSKSLAQSCCPSAPFGWAVIALDIAAGHAPILDRAPVTARSLDGLTFTKDPPPPRV
jgi:hypothetical protein